MIEEDAEAISRNEAVSENNITDLETGSDISFEKLNAEDENDGIMVTSLDEDIEILLNPKQKFTLPMRVCQVKNCPLYEHRKKNERLAAKNDASEK